MESLGNMPKVKELVTGGPGFETRTSGSDIPNFFFFFTYRTTSLILITTLYCLLHEPLQNITVKSKPQNSAFLFRS